MSSKDKIQVIGARVHNLKNIDVTIPRNSLTVITGLSGSGKSSLAFDTIYAEGQRRYIETFSAYVRNFLGGLERPDVDKITGLSPVISIEQKTTNKNPRSTVGTQTEIYDFLRLLYARAAEAYSWATGEKMVKYTEEKIIDLILSAYEGKKVLLLAPVVRNRKGHYKELFESIRKKGFLTVRIDGEIREILPGMKVDRYKNHDIEVVVDKLVPQSKDYERLRKSVAQTLEQGKGLMMICLPESGEVRFLSKHLMCPTSGVSYREPAPHNFSFNSAQGACSKCKGLGYVNIIDREKVIPDESLSIRKGGLAPLGKYRSTLIFWCIKVVLNQYDLTLDTPIKDIPEEALDEIFNGSAERLRIPASIVHTTDDYYADFGGLVKYIQQMAEADMTAAARRWAEQFSKTSTCPRCGGARLNREARSYRFADKTIHELATMDISCLYEWLDGVEEKLNTKDKVIATEILKELRTRLKFLIDVGLGYLSLDRATMTLSGGESQRVKLATELSKRDTGSTLYILDEPTTGLDPQTRRLLWSVIAKLRREERLTVFLTTHYMEEAAKADKIIIMDRGKIVTTGTPFELKETYATDKVKLFYENGEEKEIAVTSTLEALPIIEKVRNEISGFEVIQGNMDDVFLNVTGRKLEG